MEEEIVHIVLPHKPTFLRFFLIAILWPLLALGIAALEFGLKDMSKVLISPHIGMQILLLPFIFVRANFLHDILRTLLSIPIAFLVSYVVYVFYKMCRLGYHYYKNPEPHTK